MIELDPERIASAAGAEILARGAGGRPGRAVVDSRLVEPGDLFVGLPGERADGADFAPDALAAGAWGVLVEEGRAAAVAGGAGGGWVLGAADPLAGLQGLARAWRERIGCPLVGITGSTGKTSVKDICRALLPGRVHASPANHNTEIGMPLALLAAPPETDVLVMEMAMRGPGQIAELAAIALPDVAAITNVGPVHLELLGSLDAIAAAKAEIVAGLSPGGTAVLPADPGPLAAHLPAAGRTVSFGPGGDVRARSAERAPGRTVALIETPGGEARFELPFEEDYNLTNALCAVAIGVALGVPPEELAARSGAIAFSSLRGERVALRGGALILNDSYNANPVSMRAALANLRSAPAGGRRLALLGGMAELGPGGPRFHAEIGAFARELGIDELVGIGELARDYAPDRWFADPEAAAEELAGELRPGDVALVKGSRAIAMERLTDALRDRLGEAAA